jgi:hypothetical protein
MATATEENVSCCYAVQDKVWVDAPDGEPWEIYTVLADAEHPTGQLRGTIPVAAGGHTPDGDACCGATPAGTRCC